MAERFATIDECGGYQTATDPTNTPPQMLVAGSQNVLVDQQKKVKSRAGYTLLGAANAALTPVKAQAPTWNSSNGMDFPMRPYGSVLETYLETVDGVSIDAYTQVMAGLNPNNVLRFGTWFDNGEDEDVLLFVQGDANIYEWGGGVAVVASVSNATGIVDTINGPNTNISAEQSSGGAGYVVGDVLTISGGGGTGATIQVDQILSGGISGVSIGLAGTGYSVNDLLTLTAFSGVSNGIVKVTSVDGSGHITGISILVAGSGYFPHTYLVTGGTGSAAQIIVTTVGNTISAWHVLAGGSGYSTGASLATMGGTGTGATVAITAIATGSITKAGTNTFAQNRFYATRNMALFCVRTGTQYAYSGGVDSLTLVGVGDTTGLIAGDILMQQPVIQLNAPTPPTGKTRTNDTLYVFNNQAYIGSNNDTLGYISKNTSYFDFTYSSPRLTGEGGLLTLDAPIKGFGAVGNNIVAFAGRSSMFSASFAQISITQDADTPAILSETLNVKKLNTGVDQSAQSQEVIVPIGNQLAYLSFEPALRIIKNPSDVEGIDPQTFSNPIKPDFDGIDWTGAAMLWYKNTLNLSAPTVSRLYMLEFTQDADGVTTRFWQPPQILPVDALSIIDDALIGHSNAVPETYQLFNGGADRDYTNIAPADRIPFKAIARFAYSDSYYIPKKLKVYANRSALKCFDQYYSEGEVAPGTQISLNLYYDFGGATQVLNKIINGEDGGVVQEDINLSSLGQSSFGQQPLGGSSVEPSNKLRYKVIFDMPMEDYYQIAEEYITEQVDAYFAVISRGPNAGLSSHIDTIISR